MRAIDINTVPVRPYTLIVRATERCEVACDHCSISAVPHGMDMSHALLERAVHEAERSGVGLVHFSGGEPLLHAELERFVQCAAERGLFVEVTTSTYTTGKDRPVDRVQDLKKAGLERVMVSYDAAHAQSVPIDQYAEFILTCQANDIEVCAVVVEWNGTPWPLDRVRQECVDRGVEAMTVDWCRVQLSLAGRATRRYADVANQRGAEPRCPYVITAPTLAPNGTVYLCPNIESRSKLFRLGNLNERSLDDVLNELSGSPFYRALASLGPHGLARAIKLDVEPLPSDMCACCRHVLKASEEDSVRHAAEAAAPDSNTDIPLDLAAR